MRKLEIDSLLQDVRRFQRLKVSDVHGRIATIISDRRTGVERHLARYAEAGVDKEFYPAGLYCNANTTNGLNVVLLTALAPVDTFLPEAGMMYEIEYVHALCSPFAGNRELAAVIYDGANQLPIYLTGVAALPTNSAGLIHPTDELMAAAVFPGTRNTFKVRIGAYIQFTAVGLVAAETVAIMVHNVHYDVGGLRE